MNIDTPPPPPTRPPGRARQRIQQRREERLHAASREPRRPSLPQLSSAGGFKLPRINVPQSQLLPFTVVGGVLFIVVIVFILGRIRDDGPELLPNALWVGESWTYQTHSEDAIATFTASLRSHEIGTVYAWLSWLQADLTWNSAERFEDVRTFVAQFKAAYPNAQLLAWIAVPLDAGQGYRLENPDVLAQVAQLSATAVDEFGFDGVFLDVPVLTDDDNFLGLLRSVRASLDETNILAASILPDLHPSDSTVPAAAQIAPGTELSFEFKQSVVLLLDQIAIMSFYSALPDADSYSTWTAYQIESYVEAIESLGADIPTTLIVGIPTLDADPRGHDPAVENIASAMAGIRLAQQRLGEQASYVRGAGLYAEYTTDDNEWAAFDAAW